MQYRVTVSEGMEGGQIVSVNAEGAQFNVRIPPEVKPGETFLFSLTQEQLHSAQQKQHKQQQQLDTKDNDTALVLGTTQPHTLVLFHDFADLGIALCLGCIIGIAIVVGFVLGVLFVTDPLPQ